MEAEIFKHSLQAASPDEIALVEWTTKMGLALIERSNSSIKLKTDSGRVMSFTIMQIFPFTSEAKRMGLSLPGLALGEQLYLSVQAKGWGRNGTHALMMALAEMSGIDWKNRKSFQ